MTRRPNEIDARMAAEVALLSALGLLLLPHIRLVLVIDKVDDRNPRVAVVHVVAKARSINNRQLDLELLLLKLSLDNLDLRELVELFLVAPRVVLGRGELRREEGVDKSRFSQTGLADDHHGEVRTALGDDFVPLRVLKIED